MTPDGWGLIIAGIWAVYWLHSKLDDVVKELREIKRALSHTE